MGPCVCVFFLQQSTSCLLFKYICRVFLNLQRVRTCPLPFRCEFRCVDDPIYGSLGNSVLLLQQLDGLPQLIQLRVLQRVRDEANAATVNVQCVFKSRGAAFTFCSAVSVRLFSLMVMLPRLCSNAATRWACRRNPHHVCKLNHLYRTYDNWALLSCWKSSKWNEK